VTRVSCARTTTRQQRYRNDPTTAPRRRPGGLHGGLRPGRDARAGWLDGAVREPGRIRIASWIRIAGRVGIAGGVAVLSRAVLDAGLGHRPGVFDSTMGRLAPDRTDP
jgi:hypothetical protein